MLDALRVLEARQDLSISCNVLRKCGDERHTRFASPRPQLHHCQRAFRLPAAVVEMLVAAHQQTIRAIKLVQDKLEGLCHLRNVLTFCSSLDPFSILMRIEWASIDNPFLCGGHPILLQGKGTIPEMMNAIKTQVTRFEDSLKKKLAKSK